MEDFYRNLKLTSVVLSGGGTYGIKMLYLLHQLDTIGSLKDVKYWSGTSVGAICALCMTVGI
jgi:predicted acylesterase/phospholipase RssA